MNPYRSMPKYGLTGLKENWKSDMLSGFMVFLIALPLCLGISMASGFPAIAGVFTAVIGGMVVSFFGGSHLTIKGPAAGLIVIALGAVEELGKGDMLAGYEHTLAVIVVAGVVQIFFGVFRLGFLGDFFPSTVIHGMMAAIGVIIASKQIHTLLGVKPSAEDVPGLLAEIPHSIAHMNPKIMIIGIVSLLILFIKPLIKNRYVKAIPAPLVVILVAIPLAICFNMEHEHTYIFLNNREYMMGPQYLVTLPQNMFSAIKYPDFSQILSLTSVKYIFLFAVIGSVESLLSSKAIDTLDPYKRKSNLDRDLLGIGFGNTISGLMGGLPMISEIVRSSANVNNGAKTWWSNFFHGMFLLIFVAFFPNLIHKIPLTALAAMLVYTGYRLASPEQFVKTYLIGKEQLLIFLITILVTVSTDLLIGIGSGILLKLFIHLYLGLPVKSIINPLYKVDSYGPNSYLIKANQSAVFSNYIQLKKKLNELPRKANIHIDFSDCNIIDHTVMEHLHLYKQEYENDGGTLELTGLQHHKKLSDHPLAVHIKKSL